MSYYEILAVLPKAHTAGTASQEMHLNEYDARTETLATLLNTICDKAEVMLLAGDTEDFLATLAHGWQYMTTLHERRPKFASAPRDQWEAGTPTAEAVGRLTTLTNDNVDPFPEDEDDDEDETTGPANITFNSEDADENLIGILADTHATAAFTLASARALREHIRGLAGQGPLTTGHALAAIGFDLTLHRLTDELSDRHEEQCHHCDLVDSAYEAADTARKMLYSVRLNIPPVITTVISESILGDPEAEPQARSLAAQTLDGLRNHHLYLAGTPFDPHRSLHCYFVQGVLHASRLSEPFPKGVGSLQAQAIAASDAAIAEDHAKDHDPAAANLIAARADQVLAEADQMLHNVADFEIDYVLQELAATTNDPLTQARAAFAFLGNADIAQRHMLRNQDIFPPATPEQADAVAGALERAQVNPHLASLIDNLMRQGAAALNAAPDRPGTRRMKQLLEAAATVNDHGESLVDLAYAMGFPLHHDPEIERSIDDLEGWEDSEPGNKS